MILVDHPLSPYAQKVRVVLHEKQIEFESREIWRHDQHDELLALNPRGEVPALIDDETVVTDSAIICEYLEERFPEPPLMPADPGRRAIARSIERLSDTSIDACLMSLALFKFFRPSLEGERPDAFERAVANLVGHYAHLERRLGDADYFAGELSRADLALNIHVATAAYLGYPPTEGQPRLAKWLARMSERPSTARTMAEMLAAIEKASTIDEPFFENDRLHWRDSRIEWLLRCGLGSWLGAELEADRAFFSPIPD
jgi:glutathione S-transferase